jgi:glyoxylase-like metal-dependent hydrolase (beta-lactamase superfamily II)
MIDLGPASAQGIAGEHFGICPGLHCGTGAFQETSMLAEPNFATLSRRGFLGAAAAAAGTVLLPGRGWARQPAAGTTWFEWKKLTQNVYVAAGEGGNSIAIVGKGELILVDSKNPGFGATLRREAEALGLGPVRTLINTHHHADHVGGNSAFTKDCVVLAHANAKPRFAAQEKRLVDGGRNSIGQVAKNPKSGKEAVIKDLEAYVASAPKASDFEPTKTIAASETLTIAGVKIELTHVGNGHTDNDLIVYLPDENVLHGGDLLFHKVWPFVDRPGGFSSEGWAKSAEKIIEIAGEKGIVVPGHGAVGDREIAQKQRQFWIAMRIKAQSAVKAGETREQFIKRPWDEYKDYGAADWIKPITLGGVYDEAAGVPTA